MLSNNEKLLMQIYNSLLGHFGPQEWWPAESKLEIIIGAILTQAVAWRNVEKAINNLKNKNLIDAHKLLDIEEEELALLIKPALYNYQKAKKIKVFMNYLIDNYDGNLDLMFNNSLHKLRNELLSIWGIGEETADSILLYAGNYPIFVVDAYTKRIFYRVSLTSEKISYKEMQQFLQQNLQPSVEVYNEYHALIVSLGAVYCKKKNPLCNSCPIIKNCKFQKGK
ncbi:Endonuclease III [Candidatus Syntrophocurvum alkaliphilum]|uniref:Endonuclease III n=1 Tax=Candidatus Syntrophocurvum alkaliphilum TaxID=2293317 RepID=A0A6I6DEI5_9FIRM|nr:endonuclease III domain-containing protein [Candidatus Syntrophocurvum alkaliphilum]QGT99122.1 Endonuclease III [Candidatus Syntrophocurvum alkaliphilum]